MYRSPSASNAFRRDPRKLRRGYVRALLSASVLAGTLAHAHWATAQDDVEKQACVDAYGKAQRLRRAEDLIAAREQILVCARATCPAAIKNDCVPWLEEVNGAMPSVVLGVRDGAGRDRVDVRVTMDGKPLMEHLDGKSVQLNPGAHKFRFEVEGEEAVEVDVLIKTGEKNRSVTVTVGKPAETPVGIGEPGVEERPTPALVYVFGGVGLLGWGGLAYFGTRFDSQVNDLNRCDPNCPQTQIDDAASTRRLAFVSLGVGAVGTGLAAYFYLTRPTVTSAGTAAPATTFGIVPMRQGAAGMVVGSF